jgi:hypothetical protein
VTRRVALWLLPGALALHNAEEAVAFPRFLPVVRAHAPAFARSAVDAVTLPQMYLALLLATLVPLAVVIWAQARPASDAARWLALLVAAVLLVNVLSHVTIALLLRGYAPGVATAVALNLPCCAYLLRRAARERWLGPRALAALAPAAVVVHGPLLLGLIALAGALARD